MKLIGNRILIEPLPQVMKSEGGIHFAAKYSAENRNHVYFRVLAVGSGYKTRKGVTVPIELSVGQRIIAHSFQGDRAHLENGRKIIDASEVLAVVHDAPELKAK